MLNGKATLKKSEKKYRERKNKPVWSKQKEKGLDLRDAILEAVAFAAKELLSTDSWEQKIHAVLTHLGKATDISRVSIFQIHYSKDNKLLVRMRFEWVGPGIRSQIDNPEMQNLVLGKGMRRWQETLSKGEIILGHVRDFPDSEQEELNPRGVKSICAVPIFVWQKWWGYIVFYEREFERVWSIGEIEALKTAAAALGAAIQRREMEDALKNREKELEIKNRKLEDVNSTLKILLKKREDDKKELEEKVLHNMKQLVIPYLEKLNETGLNHKQEAFTSILQSNLNDIVSPFAYSLSSKYLNLTPTELQVADFVKHGKRTKEIAEQLNLSNNTIKTHRDNIRLKLGLKNKKVNLRTFLLALP